MTETIIVRGADAAPDPAEADQGVGPSLFCWLTGAHAGRAGRAIRVRHAALSRLSDGDLARRGFTRADVSRAALCRCR